MRFIYNLVFPFTPIQMRPSYNLIDAVVCLFTITLLLFAEPTSQQFGQTPYGSTVSAKVDDVVISDFHSLHFTPGNVVVCRVGNGAMALSNASTPVFLDEYNSMGTLISSLMIPITYQSSNFPLTVSGTADTECMITRSADRRYLVITGYAASPGVASIAGTLSSNYARVIGTVDAYGVVNITTSTTAFSSANIRSATTVDGSAFWAVGGNSGVVYQLLGGSGLPTTIASNVTNNRVVNIFGDQLFVSGSSGSNRLSKVGSGLPSTTGSNITNLPGFPVAGNPHQYFFADLSTSVDGVDTVYVADQATTSGVSGGGIKKFSLIAGFWTYNGTFPAISSPSVAPTLFIGLAGEVTNGTVRLFATRNGQQLIYVEDTSGYNSAPSAIPQLISVASINNAYRGVALAPEIFESYNGMVQFSSASYSGNEDGGPISVTVTRTDGSAGAISVDYGVAAAPTFIDRLGGGTATGGTSCTEGVDYITPSGTLNWAGGDSADKTIQIQLCPDAEFEPDESFVIELTSATGGAQIGEPSEASIAILNDDAEPTPTPTSSPSPTPTPDPFVVDVTSDEGDESPGDGTCATESGGCSLRAAIDEANALSGEQEITFGIAGLMAGVSQTIVLGSEVTISDDVKIIGPGADQLSIDGGPGSNRIFSISGAATEISGVTLAGGGGQGLLAPGRGGAVYAINADVSLIRIRLGWNTAINSGIAVAFEGSGSHRIERSLVASNSGFGCGAIAKFGTSDLVIENTTISGNSIGAGNAGAAICTFTAGITAIRNSTITANSGASFTGGVYHSGGTLAVGSTIISANSAPARPEIFFASGTFISEGFNLIGDSAGDAADTSLPIAYLATDILDTAPLLGTLQDNGGPTATHRPMVSSPVIDTGSSFGAATDQRGFQRIFDIAAYPNAGDGADIGAFELVGPTSAFVSISGRVQNNDGLPIRGAVVTVYGGGMESPMVSMTGTFGNFVIEGLRAGETYVLVVNAGRFTFDESVILVTPQEDTAGLVFIGRER